MKNNDNTIPSRLKSLLRVKLVLFDTLAIVRFVDFRLAEEVKPV